MLGGTALLTLQALGEFSNVAMRRYRLAVANVRTMTEDWSRAIPVCAADETDLASALATLGRHRLQFWDAMLWATARRVGVRYLLTEDFQDGRELDGVTFVNPFNRANDALIERILPG
jgi:predicted nucleic acid-binding protein